MERIRRDIVVALRGFRRDPAFTVTAVLILGLGIGMATAMWAVLDPVLLRRPPVTDPDRVVMPRVLDASGADVAIDLKDVDQIRRDSRTMQAIAGYGHGGAFQWPMMDGDRPFALFGSQVQGQFFDVLGVHAVLGRLLRPEDDSLSRVLVLSYDAWQRYFHGDPAVIGRQIRHLNLAVNYTIVGVAPPGIDFPAGTEYWEPLPWYQAQDVIARLAPHATPAAARTEFFDLETQLLRKNNSVAIIHGSDVRAFDAAVIGPVRPVLLVLAAAVGLLLTIACINVGNLLLLRAATRTRELAVRRALGATYGDVVRQLLVESGCLAIAGGVLGFVTAEIARHALIALAPAQLPRLDAVRVANAPIGAAAVLALASVMVFGVLPSLTAVRRHPASPLRLDARSGRMTRQGRHVRQFLVASQVALALILLAGAGLLARSLERLESLDLGFRADHLLLLHVVPEYNKYPDQHQGHALCDAIIERLRTLPGVTAVTPSIIGPFIGRNFWAGGWQAEGQSLEQAAANPRTPFDAGGPDYFRTLGTPIVRGRPFLDTDRDSSQQVAVVSQSFARLYWPSQDPIGKRIRVDWGPGQPWRTVVGVAGESRFRSLREPTPMVYVPYAQSVWQGLIVLRVSARPDALVPAIRREIAQVDPTVTLWTARTMDDYLAAPLSQPRLSALLLSAFGLVALALAAIGLYGIMASAVREQMRDIGVRMALGATPARVRGEILRRALAVSLLGATAGLAGALAASRLLSSLLFEVSPTDPLALLSACGTLLIVAAIAAYVPARHASLVDPASALKLE